MTEPAFATTYTARWVGDDYTGLPRASVVQMRVDDVRAAREETELAERAENHAEAVMFAHRGRDCSLAGVFARAEAECRRSDYRAERELLQARIASGEVVVMDAEPPVQRSELPGSRYELASQLERASQLHRDLVMTRARYDFRAKAIR